MKFTSTRFTRAAAAATLAVAVTAGAAAAPANAWENTFDESKGRYGTCTLSFTAEERDRINGAYRKIYETAADKAYEKIPAKEDAKTWYTWAKANPDRDPTLHPSLKDPDYLAVSGAQRRMGVKGQESAYFLAGRALKQSRKPVLEEQTLVISPVDAQKRLDDNNGFNVGSVVVPALWGFITGGVSMRQITDMIGGSLNDLGPSVKPPIDGYTKALKACANRETTTGEVKEGSSLKTDQFIGAVAGGVLGLIALLGLIAVAVGPLVNDFFTNFWKNVGVLR